MGEKSVKKKQFILETARRVFAEKGYKAVTMKDIVDACEISRGGLYLYYESTKQIFLEILDMEGQEQDDVFSSKIDEDSTPSDILALLLKEQKREILQKKDSLTLAIYEFYFENKDDKKNNTLRKAFSAGVKVLERLIEAGCETGEFYCEDPAGLARNIMYVMEGLKISAQTIGITEKTVDEAVYYIMSGLIVEE